MLSLNKVIVQHNERGRFLAVEHPEMVGVSLEELNRTFPKESSLALIEMHKVLNRGSA